MKSREPLRRRMAMSRQMLNQAPKQPPASAESSLIDFALSEVDKKLLAKQAELQDLYAQARAVRNELDWLQTQRQQLVDDLNAEQRRLRSSGNGQ